MLLRWICNDVNRRMNEWFLHIVLFEKQELTQLRLAYDVTSCFYDCYTRLKLEDPAKLYMNSYITGCFRLLNKLWPRWIHIVAESPPSECHPTNKFNSSNRMFKIFNAINVNHLLGKIPNFEYFVIEIGWRLKVVYSFWQKSKFVLGSSWWL